MHRLILILLLSSNIFAASDPLPSWRDGNTKTAILNFVHDATDQSNPKFIAPNDRYATFDMDGTLLVEKPMSIQVLFSIARIIELAPKHPEWKTTTPYKYLLAKDKNAIANFKIQDLIAIVRTAQGNVSVEEYETAVKKWLATAKDSRWHRHYTELAYQPMLELLTYLQANGFTNYIVTGSDQDLARVYSKAVYSIPKNHVVGTAMQTIFANNELIKTDKQLLNDNFAGKAENIHLFIGGKPHAAFGNSIGDQQMLQYTQTNSTPTLMMLIHHDDAEREYAYDVNGNDGEFSQALMQYAQQHHWIVISMKNDWLKIFKFNIENKPN